MGAIAMLIGTNAALALVPPRGNFMDHVYDFYKPTLRNDSYPIVDGYFSISCYMKALHECYKSFTKKFNVGREEKFSVLKDVDYVVFHSPYCKIVQKAFAKLILFDAIQNKEQGNKLNETQNEILSQFS